MHFLLGQTSYKASSKCYPLNTAAGWQGGLRVTTVLTVVQSHVFKKAAVKRSENENPVLRVAKPLFVSTVRQSQTCSLHADAIGTPSLHYDV